MTNKIIDVEKAIGLSSKLRSEGKTIVLVGGVFDILHVGHVRFLEEAKKKGDSLFLLLESDESVRKIKGKNRPLNSQKERAEVLAALNAVDFVILLFGVLKDEDYDRIVFRLRPAMLATTENDSKNIHMERQAKKIGAKVLYVIQRLKSKSTSKIVNSL